MNFSENLLYLRKKNKITQEELADKLGVSRQSVSKWETGEAYPETEKLIDLCDIFGVTLDDMVRGGLDKQAEKEEKTEEKEEPTFDKEAFKAHMNRFSLFISLGVFLVLLGVTACLVLSGVSLYLEEKEAELTAIMSGVAVLVFVAPAIFCFVYSGIRHEAFKKENPAVGRVFGEQEIKDFSKRFTLGMSLLVSAILLDAALLITLTSLIGADVIRAGNSDSAYCFVVAAFMGVLAFIVSGIVALGIKRTTYYTEEYDGNSELHPRAKLKDALCGAVMMLAAAVFLVLGFVWNLWHPAWVVFPVGGILCGIIDSVTRLK